MRRKRIVLVTVKKITTVLLRQTCRMMGRIELNIKPHIPKYIASFADKNVISHENNAQTQWQPNKTSKRREHHALF